MKRYAETHDGRFPEEDGVEMVERRIDGKLQKVVLVKVSPEGEWDFDVVDRQRARLTEYHDDGTTTA